MHNITISEKKKAVDLEKSTKGYSGGHGGESGREKSNCIIVAKAIFKSKKKNNS